MKTILSAILFQVLYLFPNYSHAQIQFVQNKGQWDSKVKFRQDFNNGAFFLTEIASGRIIMN